MVTEKLSAAGKGVRKRLITVQEIREAIAVLDTTRAKLDAVLLEVERERITAMAFDGVGNAARATMALGSYVAAIRGAIDDPKCEKVYAPPEVVQPVAPKKKGKA